MRFDQKKAAFRILLWNAALVARSGIEPETFGLWARRATAALPRDEVQM